MVTKRHRWLLLMDRLATNKDPLLQSLERHSKGPHPWALGPSMSQLQVVSFDMKFRLVNFQFAFF